LVDDKASIEFQDSLRNSTFSLCPSGSGPNSIRLWESIGAGSIPVILADTYAPPGPRDLWERAAVFCAETKEAVRALPERLRALAAEPGRLRAMRQALRQLWLLYGRDGFVSDVQALMCRLAGTSGSKELRSPRQPPSLSTLGELFLGQLDDDDASLVLSMLGNQLLTDIGARDFVFDSNSPVYALCERARTQLPPGHPSREQFEKVLAFTDGRARDPLPGA
jgi:hypothetical protein